MKTTHSRTRRDFLKNAGLATTGLLILPSGFLRGQNAPSNRVNIASVGVAGMGRQDIDGISNTGARIIGLCDVDAKRLADAKKRHGGAAEFSDYRVMFDKLGKDIDAVSVSTPDHTHFTVAYSAVDLGKHVYVQKPLCHTIDQVRRLTKLAIERKVVTQMGNQGQSSPHIRKAKEWYEAGLLGNVSLVEAWSNRPQGGGWKQGMASYLPTEKTPDSLDWNLWLGPVSERPYSPEIHPFKWRGYYEFGCGALGDMAIHLMNDAYYVLDLTAPTDIEVDIPGKSQVAYPTTSTVTFHFPANDKRGPVKVVWYDGGLKPKTPKGGSLGSNGSILHGEKFVLSLCGWGNTFVPFVSKETLADINSRAPGEKYKRIKGSHYRNWVDAIRNGGQATSHFAYSGPFAEVILLGVIAQRLGRPLKWNAQKGEFVGDPEANQLIKAPASRRGFLS